MYLNFLRDSGAAPTAGTSFLKAWAFMRYTVGAGFGQKESLLSGRVQGAARSMYLKKRKLKQAPPLPADTVWALEDMMHCESVRDDEKVILGFILFLLRCNLARMTHPNREVYLCFSFGRFRP